MKTFHLYWREPKASPERVVSDYTPKDLAAYRERFKPIVARYHRRSRIALFGMVAFFLCIFLSAAVSKHLSPYFIVSGICGWFFIVFTSPGVPDCPACGIQLDDGFGEFCPECGSRSLRPANWFRWSPVCDSCGKSMRRGKRRYYKIRACTHCGVMLDDRGL